MLEYNHRLKMTDKFKALEKIIKGGANHWRLKILFLIAGEPRISLTAIAEEVGGHFKTISIHTKILVESGLVEKRYQNRTVLHSLSPLGEKFLTLAKKIF